MLRKWLYRRLNRETVIHATDTLAACEARLAADPDIASRREHLARLRADYARLLEDQAIAEQRRLRAEAEQVEDSHVVQFHKGIKQ